MLADLERRLRDALNGCARLDPDDVAQARAVVVTLLQSKEPTGPDLPGRPELELEVIEAARTLKRAPR